MGSLVWGYIAKVKYLGSDLYELDYQEWEYDSYGEPVVDKKETVILHGACMLQYLFERLPFDSMVR